MITTHVLDTSLGRPAGGVAVVLERQAADGSYVVLGRGQTDQDGRCRTLVPPGTVLTAGPHRLRFETRAYFETGGREAFFPEVAVLFQVRDPAQHHHVPLLLSPYGYSTYRGS